MTPDPADPADPVEGSKRKKVKVLLRKQIPAPLLSHVSLSDDDGGDDDASGRTSTPTPVTPKASPKTPFFRNVKFDPKIPAPLLVGGLSLQVKKLR